MIKQQNNVTETIEESVCHWKDRTMIVKRVSRQVQINQSRANQYLAPK